MAYMPGATLVLTVAAGNFSPEVTKKIGTVTHVVVGTASSAIAEFETAGTQLSAHFVIAGPDDPHYGDGQIIQMLDTDVVCYAQGAGNWAPTSYIAKEFGGLPTTPMSANQLEASAQIDAWASKVHGFPLVGIVSHGTTGCTTHCNPNGTPDPAWGNHVCPGPIRLAQVPGVIARANVIAGNQPIPTEKPMPVTQTVSYHSGTLNHVFQQSQGSLWHKWQNMAGAWHNECLAGPKGGVAHNGNVTFVGQPEVSVINSQCCLTVEDSNMRAWYFAQTSGSSTWGVNQLP